jgi:ABC-type glutathione transport system ATPase component
MRIKFTKQLNNLRDDTVTEVVFSNELTNIERKFLHKLSEELGLKSKSSGLNENRKITVTKQSAANSKQADSDLHMYEMDKRTSDLLKLHYSKGTPAGSNSTASTTASKASDSMRNKGYSKAASLSEDSVMLKAAHLKAQSEKEKRPGYALSEQRRALLPAFLHKSAVSSLIKQEQIVLVSGETGCGKSKSIHFLQSS